MDKVIISAAITGAVHTPSMSPYLPITPEQLADEAEQVKEVVQIADALGREVATPDEARDLLGLKGLDKVGF